jgi:hypothetical protein
MTLSTNARDVEIVNQKRLLSAPTAVIGGIIEELKVKQIKSMFPTSANKGNIIFF